MARVVVDRTEPRYVNSVTSFTECPLTGKCVRITRIQVLDFYQDTCRPSFDAVVSKMSRAV